MRALLLLLTIASTPLGPFATERPADARRDDAQVGDGRTPQIPLFTAELNDAGPLFFRKVDGNSSGDAPVHSGGSSGERLGNQANQALTFRATAAPPSGPVLAALHLRI